MGQRLRKDRWRAAPVRLCGLIETLSVLLFAATGGRADAALPFTIEIVDQSATYGFCPCIAMGSNGNLHFSFPGVGQGLIYATTDGNLWTLERVDTTGNVGFCSSLALDSRGEPHIAYWDRTLDRLRYAWRNGGVWQSETVDSGWKSISVALKLDAQDRPRVTYSLPLTFWYAERGAGGWIKTQIDQSVQGYQSDLVIDSSGRLHIIYQDEFKGDLHYALRDGPQWSHELVDSTDVVGDFCTLALDGTGTLHTAYFDWTNTSVRYAKRTGNGWVVERTGLSGGTPFVAIDPWGAPHISYYRDDGHIAYASRNTGSWSEEVVDPSNFSGPASALTYDAHGNPYIVFEHQADNRLRLADTALHLHAPVGGEKWSAGDAQLIHWRGEGNIMVQLSPNGGASYPVQYQVVSDTSLTITAPPWSTGQARCRIERTAPYSISQSEDFSIDKVVAPQFALRRPFPNPWPGAEPATFGIFVPSPSTITIELFDVQGRMVSRRSPVVLPGGQLYPVLWDPGRIPSGLYFVRASSSLGQAAHARWVVLH